MIEKIVNVKVQEDGFDNVSKKAVSLDSDLNQLENQNEKLSKSFQNSSNSVLDNGGAMGLLNDLTGGYAMMAKDAVEASDLFTKSTKAQTVAQTISNFVVGTSTGALKLFRIALVSTGIGAIVVGLGLLIANFSKVKDAVMTLIPGLKAVGDFVMTIVDSITDFIGVTSDASRELEKLNSEAENNLKRNQRFLDAYGDKYDEFTKRKIEANNNYYNKVKEINEAEDLSERQKLKSIAALRDRANRDILKAEEDRQKEMAEKRSDELEKQKEDAQKRADAEKKRLDDIRKAEEEAFKAKQEQYKAEAELYFKSLDDAKAAREQLAIDQLAELDAFTTQQSEINEKAAQDALALEKAVADGKKEIQQQSFDVLEQGISLFSSFAGKNKAIQKGLLIAESAVGIAKIITSTQAANAGALATPQAIATSGAAAIPVITLNTVKASIGIAANIAATAKAMQSLGGGGGSASVGGAGGAGGSAPPPPPQFNIVGQSGTNQLAQSIGAKQGQPIQAYVVGNEVTSQQALDRNRINTATFN